MAVNRGGSGDNGKGLHGAVISCPIRKVVAIQSTREVLFYARGGQSVYKRVVSSLSLYLRCYFFNIAVAITIAIVMA